MIRMHNSAHCKLRGFQGFVNWFIVRDIGRSPVINMRWKMSIRERFSPPPKKRPKTRVLRMRRGIGLLLGRPLGRGLGLRVGFLSAGCGEERCEKRADAENDIRYECPSRFHKISFSCPEGERPIRKNRVGSSNEYTVLFLI